MRRQIIRIPKAINALFLTIVGTLFIYVLSIGPVWRVFDPKMTGRLPKWGEVFYRPLCRTQIPWVNDTLDWYLSLWFPAGADSDDIRRNYTRQP